MGKHDVAEPTRARRASAREPAAPVPAPVEQPGAAASAPRVSIGDLSVLPPGAAPIQRAARPNRTGLPDRLKAGVEALSGVSMDDVRVHRNSPEPAKLGALAHAQGSAIHLGPGQEHHLPHEAWHIVQQKQGRVRPTMQLAGVAVNDEGALEREAESMGDRALRVRLDGAAAPARRVATPRPVLQPFWELNDKGKVVWVNGPPPSDYVKTDRTKGGTNPMPVYAHPDVVAGQKQQARNEEAERYRILTERAKARALPPKSRSQFSRTERQHLQALPRMLIRQDHDLTSNVNERGGRKAHLIDQGLQVPGGATLTAAEQMDQNSKRKEQGNRVSSKAPYSGSGVDNSQSYGGQQIGIKARKLERARLRGKSDAQHVQTLTTNQIVNDLNSDRSLEPDDRNRYTSYARRDREHHTIVDFLSPDNPKRVIPNRFLKYNGNDIHDSDSDSDSEDEREERKENSPPSREAVASSSPVPEETRIGVQDKFWDEDYGMTHPPRKPRESDDPPGAYG